MKFRSFILLAIPMLLVSACNFTLAEDVTPPPGYVAPTPLPTLVLSPAQAPSVESGRLIYAEKCAACHGQTGLGDGEQGIQLGVSVPAFGLPEVARRATPAGWFTTVTRGRMDRFMPPFASLNDQERWDVVAYAMTLHMTEEQVETGREIFKTRCAGCPTDVFEDQARMAALNGIDLARIVRQGSESVPAFGADLSDEEMWAAAAYLRTLSFDYSLDQTSAPGATAQTPVRAEPAPAETSQPAPAAREGFGTVSGSIENRTGEDLPAGTKVILRGFDHGADPSAGPQEVISREVELGEDGSYRFEDVEMPRSRIYLTELEHEGVKVQSDFAIVEEGMTSISLPPLVLYPMTEDTSRLVMDDVQLFLDYEGSDVSVYGVYSFRNPSDRTVVVELKDGREIPFIANPEGTANLGYEALQDSAPFANTEKGLAIPPSERSYGLISFTTVPKQERFEIAQPFILPVSRLTVYLPEGVRAQSPALTDTGVQTIRNFNFQVYTASSLPAGETVRLTVSGRPEQASAAAPQPAAGTNRNLLIGAGVLGLALILAGGWMYLRDRGAEPEEDADESEFESSEDVLDAIVALDDLHRAKKISEEAYHKRRAELKEILKGMM